MKKRFGGLLTAALFLVAMTTSTALAKGADYIKNHPGADASPAYVEGRLLIKMKSGASTSAVHSKLMKLSASTRTVGAGAAVFKRFPAIKARSGQDLVMMSCPGRTTEELLKSFQGREDVEIAEPDYIITIDAVPDDTEFEQLWALENTGQEVDEETGTAGADISAPAAWDRLSDSDATVIVAVIDTGVDYTHEEIAANMWTNDAELNGTAGVDDDDNGYVDDIYGIDTCNGDGDPYDDHYHGTHVAGTIAAVTDNGTGIAGITWNRAKVMALKFLSASGSGATSAAVECIEYLLEMNDREENNIVVMNASWGSDSPSDTLKAVLETAADAGIILAAASGNDTRDCDGEQKHYPSSLDVANIISVAATNQNDRLAYFSSYGASEVDIAAPGTNILSAIPGGGYTAVSTDPFYDGMEDGDGLWDMDASTGQWAISDEKVFDDTYAWSDSPGGDYEYGEMGVEKNWCLVSKPIDLSAEADKNLMLGFVLYKDLLPDSTACGKKDTFYVEVSGDDGDTWTTLAGHSGSDPDWKTYSYAIPADLVTETFRIRFRLDIWPNGSADGIYLDEVGIGEANAMGAFKFANGTSMATPHISGAIALMAALFPDEGMDERISRLLNSSDRLDILKGNLASDGRLNLDAALDPDLPLSPVVKTFELTGDRTISIEGRFFGDESGRIMFHDASDPDNGLDGQVTAWSDTAVTVEKPAYSGGYFYVIDSDGNRSGRRPMKVSLWGDKNEAQNKRDSGTACLVDGKIYSFGGFAGGNNALRSWEVYTPQTDTWEYPYGNWMLKNRAHLTSTVLDGKIYIIGGYTTVGDGGNVDLVSVFDAQERSFTQVESLPEAICLAWAVTANDKIYLTGGIDDDDNALATIYTFDPDAGEGTKWQALSTAMTTPRFAHGAVALEDKIYIFGGLEDWEDEEVYLSTGEILDLSTGTVSAMADMPIALARFGVACDGRYIYAVGGTNNDFWYTPKDVVLRYDTKTDTWSSLPDRQLTQGKLAAPAVFIEDLGLFSITGGINATATGTSISSSSFAATKAVSFLDVWAVTDDDADLIPDTDDNCRQTANAAQLDTDEDGYGNACDCDLDNDGRVNRSDYIIFRTYYNSNEALADFNGDGSVNRSDYMILRSRWNTSAPFE